MYSLKSVCNIFTLFALLCMVFIPCMFGTTSTAYVSGMYVLNLCLN